MAAQPASGYQFGTFKGVFTPSILTILGVVMYRGWAGCSATWASRRRS